jgi:hypothetical protein
MSDIFREVDEDLRREQIRSLWNRFAPYIIGLAILIVVATAGYRGWEYWNLRQAQATGDRFIAAAQLAKDGKHDEAIAALDAIAKDGSGGYPVLAGFRIAAEKAAAGDDAGAIAQYDSIAGRRGVPEEMRMLARLRAAWLVVDEANFAEVERRVGDLAGVGNLWRHAAREILGLGAWRAGDYAAAKRYFEEISDDQETPDDLRQRSQLMLSLITSREPAPAPVAKPEG